MTKSVTDAFEKICVRYCNATLLEHITSSLFMPSLFPTHPSLGVEMFKKSMDFGQAGDNIGALLRGVKRDDVIRGQVLAQPNTVKTYKKFEVHAPHVLHIY